MMKSRMLRIGLAVGVLIATTACSTVAGKSDGAVSGWEKPPVASQGEVPASPEAPRKDARNSSGITGKVVSVSEDEITLALAVMPELDKAPNSEAPRDGRRPDGIKERSTEAPGADPAERSERPSAPGGDRREPGGGVGMTFAEDAATYKLSDECVITKGRGNQAKTAGLESITAEDIVSIELDDNGRVSAISILQMDADAQSPQTSQKS